MNPFFYAVDDYYRYLDDLHHAAENNQVAIHAYVLMTNHVHLLVTPAEAFGITHMMQSENCDLPRVFRPD